MNNEYEHALGNYRLEKKLFESQKQQYKLATILGWLLGYMIANILLTFESTFINNLIRLDIWLFGAVFSWYLCEWNIRKGWQRPKRPRLKDYLSDELISKKIYPDKNGKNK